MGWWLDEIGVVSRLCMRATPSIFFFGSFFLVCFSIKNAFILSKQKNKVFFLLPIFNHLSTQFLSPIIMDSIHSFYFLAMIINYFTNISYYNILVVIWTPFQCLFLNNNFICLVLHFCFLPLPLWFLSFPLLLLSILIFYYCFFFSLFFLIP